MPTLVAAIVALHAAAGCVSRVVPADGPEDDRAELGFGASAGSGAGAPNVSVVHDGADFGVRIPENGVRRDGSERGWTLFDVRVPRDERGTIALSVRGNVSASDSMNESLRYTAALLFVGSRFLAVAAVLATGQSVARVDASAVGADVSHGTEGTSRAGPWDAEVVLDLRSAASLAPEGVDPVRFTFLALTSSALGSATYALARNGAGNASYREYAGTGAFALTARDFDSASGARASARVDPASAPWGWEPAVAASLSASVRAPCGLTGVIVAPWSLAAHAFAVRYENDLGEAGSARLVGVQAVHVGQDASGQLGTLGTVLPLRSPAVNWSFRVDAMANVGTWNTFAILYANVSPDALDRGQYGCPLAVSPQDDRSGTAPALMAS